MTIQDALALPAQTRVRMNAYGMQVWQQSRGRPISSCGVFLGMRDGMMRIHRDGNLRPSLWIPVFWEREQ